MIHLLIADDHAIVREGLKRIVADVPDMVVTAEASDGNKAIEKLRQERIDCVVLDLNMPGKNGIETLGDIKREWPTLPVLILSMHSADQYASRMIRAGAAGYLSKESAASDLIKAIGDVVAGKVYGQPNR
jgi:two-component system, NarL family, invasion response regulator UvrY